MAKKLMRHPERFVGKVIDTTKWIVPDAYERCVVTGKLHRRDDLEYSLDHWAFDKQWLKARHIYFEDAEYMSEEGWIIVERVLEREGVYEQYREIAFGWSKDFTPIGASLN